MRWLENPSFELSQDELDFIAASQKKQDQEKQLRKVLEEQQLQTEVELRNRQRFKRRAFIGGAVAVVVSATGLIWLNQMDNWYLFTPKGTTLFVYRGHIQEGIVFGVAWSPDGKRIASGSSDLRVDICNALDGGNVEKYKGHSKTVVGVAWSPDGTMIASASDDQTVQVWNAKTTRTIHIYTGHTDSVHSVQWSPNGRYLASGSNDSTVRVWDTKTKTHTTYRGHKLFVWNVAWSPDGTQIVSASSDNTVHIWDAFTGNTRQIYRGHTNEVFGVGWSPDGKYIASGGRDTTVQVWSAETGATVYTFHGHADNIDTIAWSPDGRRIASAGGHDDKSISNRDDHIVRVWDALDGGNLLIYTRHINRVHCVAWSPDGIKIVSGGFDLTVQVWKAM